MKLPGPDHPITVAHLTAHVVVRFAGQIVADTTHALELKEASYPAVLYIPRSDARMTHFQRSAHQTHCPYKGDARYFDLVAGDARVPNAVWSYEEPYPAMAEIKDHLAFYPQHVSIERDG